jgi:hypothetical protein
MAYEGNEEFTSPEPVIRYLVENYTTKDQTPLTRQEATRVVNNDLDEIRSGIRLRSFVHYTADIIANKTDWLWMEPEEPINPFQLEDECDSDD